MRTRPESSTRSRPLRREHTGIISMLRSGDRKSLSSPTRTSLRLHGTVLYATPSSTATRLSGWSPGSTPTRCAASTRTAYAAPATTRPVSAPSPSKRKAITQHGDQRRITENAPSGGAGGGFLVVGYKSDLRLDRGGGQNKKRGAYEPALLMPCHVYTEGFANRRRVFSRNGLRKRLLYAIVYLFHHRPNAPFQC